MQNRIVLKMTVVCFVGVGGLYLVYRGDTATGAALLGTMAGYVLKNGQEFLEKKSK